jgi:hypothetical protein
MLRQCQSISFLHRDSFTATYKTCTAIPTSLSFVGQSAPASEKTCAMPTFAKATAGKDSKNCAPDPLRSSGHGVPVLPPGLFSA